MFTEILVLCCDGEEFSMEHVITNLFIVNEVAKTLMAKQWIVTYTTAFTAQGVKFSSNRNGCE